jgi:hypothetical protein
MNKVRSYVLMGGMWGFDGTVFSRGMVALSQRLNTIEGVESSHHYWYSWKKVEVEILKLSRDIRSAVIGFSGGGSRLTYMDAPIDLAVGYDPSPSYEIHGVRNFKRAICYHNTLQNYLLGFRLGGGIYAGVNVELVDIAMNHLAVQYAENLHLKTIEAINKLMEK